MKKFITNNIHIFVIAALVIAGIAFYRTQKTKKETEETAA